MAGIFNAIGVAGTGVTVHRKWLDAVSDNLSNMNNVATPGSANLFRAKYVVAQAVNNGEAGEGVQVAGIALGPERGRMAYDPTNPVANKDGYVEYPDVDMSSQMTQLIMAQRGYQANLAVVDRAKEAYQAGISLGRGA